MRHARIDSLVKLCLGLCICLSLACGGGGGGGASASSGTGSSSTGSSKVLPPKSIFPIRYGFPADPDRTDIVPFMQGLVAGGGKFYFLDNAYLQSYTPATGVFSFGAMASGSWLVYESGVWSIGQRSVHQQLVNGSFQNIDLGYDYGWMNAVTSDGNGHILLAYEGHSAMVSGTSEPATLISLDVATKAIKAYPFRPWTSVDDQRNTTNPYSSIVYDHTKNVAYIVSYYHHDISKVDLTSGSVTHTVDARIAYEGDLGLDSKGNVILWQPDRLLSLSPAGSFSERAWPAGFTPGDLMHAGTRQNCLVVDALDRVWVAGYTRLACLAPSGGASVYTFGTVADGSEGWTSPMGLILDQGQLWLSNDGASIDGFGALLEFQIPPASGTWPTVDSPSITKQPSSLQLAQYGKGSISLTATGNGALTFQWKRGGVQVRGLTSNTALFPAVTGAEAGAYTCVVTNHLYGQTKSTESQAAAVTVVPDPAIPYFTAAPVRIQKGQTTLLTPYFSGGTGQIDPGAIPVTSGVGVSVMPTTTTTYTLTVQNALGSKLSSSLKVEVDDQASMITSFTASPNLVEYGQASTLSWSLNGGATSSIVQDDLGQLGPIDVSALSSMSINPIRRQQVRLTATSSMGSATATVRVAAHGLDRIAGKDGGLGCLDGLGAQSRMSHVGALVATPDGSVIFADDDYPVLRRATPAGQVSTIAGVANESGDLDGPAANARFKQISGLALSADGTLYILDHGAGKLKRLTTGGQVQTVMSIGGGGSGNFHEFMAFDSNGNLLVPLILENRVVRIAASGAVTDALTGISSPASVVASPDGSMLVLYGSGQLTLSRPDGSTQSYWLSIAPGDANASQAIGPCFGLALDGLGNPYLAASSGLYSLDTAFLAHTLTHTDGDGNAGTGWYASAAWSSNGYLWAAHLGLGSELVQIVPGGNPSSVAGLIRPYYGTGDAAPIDILSWPQEVTLGTAGRILVSDWELARLVQISKTGVISAVPIGTAVDPHTPTWSDAAGRIYFCSAGSLRRFDPVSGQIRVIASPAIEGVIRDGGVVDARIGEIHGMVGDRLGNLYFLDTVSEQDMNISQLYVRKVTPDGALVTLAGGSFGFQDGQGSAARFGMIRGLALDPDGNLVLADSFNNAIRRVTPAGLVSTIAGLGPSGWGFVDGLPSVAKFNFPRGVAVDAQGNVYVSDSGNSAIRMISPSGQVTTLLGSPLHPGTRSGPLSTGSLFAPGGLAMTEDGDLVVVDSGQVSQITAPGGQ